MINRKETLISDKFALDTADRKQVEQSGRVSITDEQYNMPVEQLNLSARILHCLKRGGINTVGELVGKKEKELLFLRDFGQKTRWEIDECLKVMGLSLVPVTVKGRGGETTEEVGDGGAR